MLPKKVDRDPCYGLAGAHAKPRFEARESLSRAFELHGAQMRGWSAVGGGEATCISPGVQQLLPMVRGSIGSMS